jgi:hypothetical protein
LGLFVAEEEENGQAYDEAKRDDTGHNATCDSSNIIG